MAAQAAETISQASEHSSRQTPGHYRIVSKIGAGGRGEVYMAQDTSELRRHLNLAVAHRSLPHELIDKVVAIQLESRPPLRIVRCSDMFMLCQETRLRH